MLVHCQCSAADRHDAVSAYVGQRIIVEVEGRVYNQVDLNYKICMMKLQNQIEKYLVEMYILLLLLLFYLLS